MAAEASRTEVALLAEEEVAEVKADAHLMIPKAEASEEEAAEALAEAEEEAGSVALGAKDASPSPPKSARRDSTRTLTHTGKRADSRSTVTSFCSNSHSG